MQTADWQFYVSDRLTGARNPARLPITIQSRRIRCAPFLLSILSHARDRGLFQSVETPLIVVIFEAYGTAGNDSVG